MEGPGRATLSILQMKSRGPRGRAAVVTEQDRARVKPSCLSVKPCLTLTQPTEHLPDYHLEPGT
jgi:hypothetical protein